jgi:hypothetical protein
MSFEIKDHPIYLAMPAWGLPGIIIGEHPTSIFKKSSVHTYADVPRGLKETLGMPSGEKLRVRATGTINLRAFARAIAKIGYCHTVAGLGLDGFRSLVIPQLILGTYPCVSHFVGCEVHAPPESDNGKLHWIKIDQLRMGRMQLLAASIRLFASSGTDEHGMPIYRVIVGAPSLS